MEIWGETRSKLILNETVIVAVELMVFGVEVIDPPTRVARNIFHVTLGVDIYL